MTAPVNGPDPDAVICADQFVLPGDSFNDAYVCQGRPGHIEAGVMHGGPNPAGKSAAWGGAAGVKDHPEEPALIRLSELRDVIARQRNHIEALSTALDEVQGERGIRGQALHQAVKSWDEPGDSVEAHAYQVTFLARAFAAYLADGTVHGDGPADEPEPPAPAAANMGEASRFIADIAQKVKYGPKVMEAAVAWVDDAHENNPSGPDNWRNWADDKDIRLINAVRVYRGLEPIDL